MALKDANTEWREMRKALWPDGCFTPEGALAPGYNIGLVFVRPSGMKIPWAHVFVTDTIATMHSVSRAEGSSYVSPLYTYGDGKTGFEGSGMQQVSLCPGEVA